VTTRAAKFRQAAIVYLHVGILYEAAVFVFWRQGILPEARGPAWLWLIIGAVLAAGLSYALWRWHYTWLALLIWALHSLRLPAILEGAFFGHAHTGVDAAVVPPAFYLAALAVVLINLGMLARAGFDL
jgi:hydrogenase-4 membrane subunit HyfE